MTDRIKPNLLPAHTLERKLSDEIVAFLRDEVAQHGDKVYYWFREYYLESGIGLAPYDVAIGYFAQSRLRGKKFLEIGAGMAQLSALLTLHGLDITAVERYEEHAVTTRRLQEWLKSKMPPATGYQIEVGGFPESGKGMLGANTVVVGMSINNKYPTDRWNKILDALGGADGLIIDLATFFEPRRTSEEQADLVRQLFARGFGEPEEIYSWRAGDGGYKFAEGRVVYLAKRGPSRAASK